MKMLMAMSMESMEPNIMTMAKKAPLKNSQLKSKKKSAPTGQKNSPRQIMRLPKMRKPLKTICSREKMRMSTISIRYSNLRNSPQRLLTKTRFKSSKSFENLQLIEISL